jgi:uncharacterized protein (TIGR02118 family)
MAKIFVLYKQPADQDAFNSHYFRKHVPLAKSMPGLRSYEVSDGPVRAPNGGSDIFKIAVLTFDSMDAIKAAMASDEGKATAADLPNFANAGADFLICDTRSL